MKNKFLIFYSFTMVFLFCITVTFSQKHKEKSPDSTLEVNSEKWRVKQHRSLAGIAKPEFGPYTTLVAEKLDSPVIKKKRKDTLGTEVSFSSDEGWDISKYKIFEKKKFYRMVLRKETDTIEMQFYIHSVSHEKRQTFLGSLLSKDDKDDLEDNNKNATLSYQKNIEGVMVMDSDSATSYFYIEDYISTRQLNRTDPSQSDPITTGYILIGPDSLYTETVVKTFGNPKSIFSVQIPKGIFMNDATGKHIAFLQFDNNQNFSMRILQDTAPDYQDAVASFFAVIIGVINL